MKKLPLFLALALALAVNSFAGESPSPSRHKVMVGGSSGGKATISLVCYSEKELSKSESEEFTRECIRKARKKQREDRERKGKPK